MRLNVKNLTNTLKNMVGAETAIDARTQAELEQFVDSLYEEIYQTSPVDTGTYKGNWEIVRKDDKEIHIKNETDYSVHLVFPNERMIGAKGADVPSRGILHNVRGIVHRRRKDLRVETREGLSNQLDVGGMVNPENI